VPETEDDARGKSRLPIGKTLDHIPNQSEELHRVVVDLAVELGSARLRCGTHVEFDVGILGE
jgi:hypothetical protein